MARKFNYNSNTFKAQYRVTVQDRRRRATSYLAEEHAPRNVRIPRSQLRGTSLNSPQEIREVMRAPEYIGSKQAAKSGCTIKDVMNGALWRNKKLHVTKE